MSPNSQNNSLGHYAIDLCDNYYEGQSSQQTKHCNNINIDNDNGPDVNDVINNDNALLPKFRQKEFNVND